MKSQKQAELLASQISAEDQNKGDSSNLVYREQIENTPFWIISTNDKDYFLVMGNHRLTEPQDTAQKVKIKLIENMWEIMMNVTLILINLERERWLQEQVITRPPFWETSYEGQKLAENTHD